MKPSRRIIHAAPVALLLLASCGKGVDPTAPAAGPGAAQEAAILEELNRQPDLVEDGTYLSADPSVVESATDAVAGRTSGATDAIEPLFFWREIRHVTPAFEFSFGDADGTGEPTTAVVTVHRRLAGWFNVVARTGTADGIPGEGRIVRKPLRDHWVRRILLKRVDHAVPAHRPWRIAAVSGVKITSHEASSRIVTLRVQSGSLDITFTDPLAFFRLRHLLKLEPESQVTLTATTLRDDDVVVLYRGDRRFRFRNNGDNTYSATWRAPAFDGVRHFGVNALSRGTLFDDEAPYDSQTWILPYVVMSAELADLAP